MRSYEAQVQYVIDAFSDLPHVRAARDFPSEAGQPMPRAEITFDEQRLAITRDEILTQLRMGDPSIALAPAGERGLYVNPQTLRPGEERVIVGRVKQIVYGDSSLTEVG
jgi:L-seryl-tRNA(Ser) seleniumtransferase